MEGTRGTGECEPECNGCDWSCPGRNDPGGTVRERGGKCREGDKLKRGRARRGGVSKYGDRETGMGTLGALRRQFWRRSRIRKQASSSKR